MVMTYYNYMIIDLFMLDIIDLKKSEHTFMLWGVLNIEYLYSFVKFDAQTYFKYLYLIYNKK